MRRREFIAFLGGMAVAAPRRGVAQTTRVYRLGTLTVLPPMVPTAGPGALLIAGLAQRGYQFPPPDVDWHVPPLCARAAS